MAQFISLTSRVVVVPQNDIDTDQIIPARFLKTTDKAGLGSSLFSDWRYARRRGSAAGVPARPARATQGARCCSPGDNFGCGSSREHAPWALAGLRLPRRREHLLRRHLPQQRARRTGCSRWPSSAGAHASLLAQLAARPRGRGRRSTWRPRRLDAAPTACACRFPSTPSPAPASSRGIDELGYILRFEPSIEAHERRACGGRVIRIYDTTLRDGTQREGISLSLRRQARRSAPPRRATAWRFIEGGWPGLQPEGRRVLRACRGPSPGAPRASRPSAPPTGSGAAADDDANLAGAGGRARAGSCTVVGKILDPPRDRGAPHHAGREPEASSSRAWPGCARRARRVIYDAEHFFDGYRGRPRPTRSPRCEAARRGGAEHARPLRHERAALLG